MDPAERGAFSGTDRPELRRLAHGRHRITPAVAVLAVAVLIAGCTSTKRSSPDSVRGPSSAVTATSVPNVVVMRKNVALQKCAAVTGGWSAQGTAVAPGANLAAYTITVYFVTNPGNTVEGSAVTVVSVPSGKTVDWVATAHFKPTTTMQCVLRGVG